MRVCLSFNRWLHLREQGARTHRWAIGASVLALAACGEAKPLAHADDHVCAALEGMAAVSVPDGAFLMGAMPAYPEEGPPRQVSVNAFSMDAHEVTNRQFAIFVEATGYQTVAERMPDPALHPNIPPEALEPGSAVFTKPSAATGGQWWVFVPDASWRMPEGPGSDIADRMDHPAVHIAYEDALAYAHWRGGDLPTEAEWEYAARGGHEAAMYEWGEEAPDDGPVRANTWQGLFPIEDQARDGFAGSAPAACYRPNAYGLHDMTGNTWEWVKDGGDGANIGLLKGGSFLCAANFCRRYRPSARQPQERDFSASHIGFRVVYRGELKARELHR